MKRSLLFAACISAILLLAGCSNPSDETKEAPVVDFPSTEGYYDQDVTSWLNPESENTDHCIVFSNDRAYCLYNNELEIEDAVLSSSDRSIIEIYKGGFIKTKKVGHVSLSLKSETQGIDITFSAFVVDIKITAKSKYTEVEIEIPDGLSDVVVKRVDYAKRNNGIYEKIGAINSRKGIEAGKYIFKDYFIDSNKKYSYSISGYSSISSWGNGFYSDSITSQNTDYSELQITTVLPSSSDGGKTVDFNYSFTSYPTELDFWMNAVVEVTIDKTTYKEYVTIDEDNKINFFDYKYNGEYILRGKTVKIIGLSGGLYGYENKVYSDYYPLVGTTTDAKGNTVVRNYIPIDSTNKDATLEITVPAN